jgi:hypothetical protein
MLHTHSSSVADYVSTKPFTRSATFRDLKANRGSESQERGLREGRRSVAALYSRKRLLDSFLEKFHGNFPQLKRLPETGTFLKENLAVDTAKVLKQTE